MRATSWRTEEYHATREAAHAQHDEEDEDQLQHDIHPRGPVVGRGRVTKAAGALVVEARASLTSSATVIVVVATHASNTSGPTLPSILLPTFQVTRLQDLLGVRGRDCCLCLEMCSVCGEQGKDPGFGCSCPCGALLAFPLESPRLLLLLLRREPWCTESCTKWPSLEPSLWISSSA